jgi:hypothetical protein
MLKPIERFGIWRLWHPQKYLQPVGVDPSPAETNAQLHFTVSPEGCRMPDLNLLRSTTCHFESDRRSGSCGNGW